MARIVADDADVALGEAAPRDGTPMHRLVRPQDGRQSGAKLAVGDYKQPRFPQLTEIKAVTAAL